MRAGRPEGSEGFLARAFPGEEWPEADLEPEEAPQGLEAFDREALEHAAQAARPARPKPRWRWTPRG